jgi:hypothetical protein
MTKLRQVIEASKKNENLNTVAQNHLSDLLDSIDVKKELRLMFHIIASHLVEAVEDPAEARKLARDSMIAFEDEVNYWIKQNKKGA